MTSETRFLVEPTDILAVELECGLCHMKMSYDLSEKVMRVIGTCPNCHENLYPSERKGDFDSFFALLKAMPKLTAETSLKIRLQVKPSDSEAQSDKH